MKFLLVPAFLCVAVLFSDAAETPKADPEPAAEPEEVPRLVRGIQYSDAPQVTIDLLAVSLPTEKALPLLPELRDPKRIKAAQEKIVGMIAKKEANLIGWPEVTTLGGTRSFSEDITEYKYPIEFYASGQEPLDSEGKLIKLEPGWKIEKASAIKFEIKNIGVTLDVEPAVQSEGNGITIAVEAQSVEVAKVQEYYMATNPKGEEVTTPHQIFATTKNTTTIRLQDGQRRLLQCGRTLEGNDRMTIFIIGAKLDDPD